MTINQISVFLENRPGQLANICRTLAEADISIVTLSLADTAEFGIVRMIVSDHDKAKEVLKKAGHVANMREVVAVTVPDRPGGMAEILDVLDAAKVDAKRRCSCSASTTTRRPALPSPPPDTPSWTSSPYSKKRSRVNRAG